MGDRTPESRSHTDLQTEEEKTIVNNQDSSEKRVRDLLAIEDLDIEALDKMLRELTSRITIKNNSGDFRWVRISKGGGTGNDAFFQVSPGETESWKRGLARRVTIEISRNDNSSGVTSTLKHSVFISTNCNDFEINGYGEIVFSGDPKCGSVLF
jgi:hypothetical protein